MSKNGITWTTSPIDLSKEFEKYGRLVLVAVRAAASKWGQEVQNEARQSAPWTDRTGNARSGIFYAVDGFGQQPIQGEINVSGLDLAKQESGQIIDRGRAVGEIRETGSANRLVIIIAHTVFYGQFLELSHGGRYGIIMSTIEKNLPRLETLIKDSFPK